MARFPFSKEFKEVRGATPDEIGMALADFAIQVPADQEIVELGVFQGRTALIMAWGAKQGHGAHVTGIDPWDLEGNVYDPPFTEIDSKRWAEYRITELGYADRITLVQAFSHDVAERWSVSTEEEGRDGQKVGLLYVDGDHTREGARRDIVSWAPHLAPGAVIAVDDYGHPDWPGVGEAVDELVAEGFLAPIEVYHDRLAVTRLASGEKRTTAITSEGVSPSPEDDWMTDPEGPVETQPGCQHPDCTLDHPHAGPAVLKSDPDTEASKEDLREVLAREGADWLRRNVVQPGEMEEPLAGTKIENLNTVQLRALAKHRGITLGARKDKRDAMLQALRDGK